MSLSMSLSDLKGETQGAQVFGVDPCSDVQSSVMIRCRGQTYLEAKILALVLTSWPRPGLGLVNLASKNVP